MRDELSQFQKQPLRPPVSPSAPRDHRCRTVVLANEKGGCGKSTLAVHLAVALMRAGLRVSTIDLDARQGTLTRYVEQRRRFADAQAIPLKLPDHHVIEMPLNSGSKEGDAAVRESLSSLTRTLARRADYIILDTPGNAGAATATALSLANIVVTPLNDSFFDLDVLVRIDPRDLNKLSIGPFCNTILSERASRRQRGVADLNWFVMRNRLTNFSSHNKQDIHQILTLLAARFNFNLLAGLTERVVYRELFLRGLTVLDLREPDTGVDMNMSHVRARQELRELLEAMGLSRTDTAVGLALSNAVH